MAWIGFVTFGLVWIGTLIFWTGKISSSNKRFEKEITDIYEEIKEIGKRFEEKAKYNEEHFVSLISHENCKHNTNKRLDDIESLKLGATLATIGTQQLQMSTQLADIQKTLEEMRKDIVSIRIGE